MVHTLIFERKKFLKKEKMCFILRLTCCFSLGGIVTHFGGFVGLCGKFGALFLMFLYFCGLDICLFCVFYYFGVVW